MPPFEVILRDKQSGNAKRDAGNMGRETNLAPPFIALALEALRTDLLTRPLLQPQSQIVKAPAMLGHSLHAERAQ